MLTPLKSTTLVGQASEQLLNYIERESLQAGDCLPSISALSEQFGASRAVIRESLKTLEARGIIEIANGRKAQIRPVTCEPLLDFFQRFMQVEHRAAWEFAEIRVALEMQCVVLAVRRGTEAELNQLLTLVKKMRNHLGNPEMFANLDVQFHLLIARASHNQLMVYLLESLRDAIKESVRKGLLKRLTRTQKETVQDVHERLVQAMIERDESAALEAMRAHFDEIAMSLE